MSKYWITDSEVSKAKSFVDQGLVFNNDFRTIYLLYHFPPVVSLWNHFKFKWDFKVLTGLLGHYDIPVNSFLRIMTSVSVI